MSRIIWYLRSGLSFRLLGLALDIAPEPEKTALAIALDRYFAARG